MSTTNRQKRRLSSVDAAFIYGENEKAPMHIGGMDIIEGVMPPEKFREHLDAKMQLIPRYRQRLIPSPFGFGHPTWEDDPEFDISNHVIAVRLPKPGTEEQFRITVSELFEGVLDRTKPLWRAYIIEGRNDRNTAILWLIHHAMVDGVSGVELLEIALDPSPESILPDKDDFHAEPIPDQNRLLSDAVWDTIEEQINTQAEFLNKAFYMARNLGTQQLDTLLRESAQFFRGMARPTPRFPFNTRNLSGKRLLSWGSVPFEEVRGIRKEVGGTLNDVILAALGGGMKKYLESHGIDTRKLRFSAACPVSLRTQEQRGSLGNQVTILPVEIPLDTADPLERLAQIVERTSALKKARAANVIDLLTTLFRGMHPLALSAIMGTASSPRINSALNAFQRTSPVHMICTNVPGPREAIYAVGHKVLHHYPLLPVGPGLGLAMGVLSYNEQIYFGYIADTNAAPDVDRFGQFIQEAFDELRDAANVPAYFNLESKIAELKAKLEVAAKDLQDYADADRILREGGGAQEHRATIEAQTLEKPTAL